MEIIGIKTDQGYYVSVLGRSNYTRYSNLNHLTINGGMPKATFHDGWSLVRSEPKTVQKSVRQPNINHRFELKDDVDFVDTSSIPKSMPKYDVMVENKDGYCEWKDEFKHLQSLYVETSDPQPDKLEDVEFTYSTIMTVDEIKPSVDFGYEVPKTQWAHEGTATLGPEAIRHQIIDQIVFPNIMLPTKPCALTSKDSYGIIREHVNKNIDSRYARVTSDYDFCFEVSKVVPITEPYLQRREITKASGRSYAKPRYREWTVKSREIRRVFEMTNAEDKYRGYTVIGGFQGKSHEDLKANIDKFLSDLMARINEPLIDCPHCDGLGVITKTDSGNHDGGKSCYQTQLKSTQRPPGI